MLRQTLTQKMQQKLSPLQIQQVKLLEVTTLEMAERIMREVDENPALEIGLDPELKQEEDLTFDNPESDNEDFSLGDYATDDDIPEYRTRLDRPSPEERREFVPVSVNTSLHDYLKEQLDLQEFDESLKIAADYVVGSIDDDGYLRRNAELLSDDLAIQLGLEIPVPSIQEIIHVVQAFDPPGVAACDLQECLLIQLRRKPHSNLVEKAIRLLETCFDDFSRKHYDVILKRMDLSNEELKEIIQEIVRLNPKPGSMYGSSLQESMEEITPDFLLENEDGVLNLMLNNSSIPELHVSPDYNLMLKDYQSNSKNQTREAREAIQFARQKVEAARWFIDAVRTRQETLMRTMQSIVDYQYDFFLDGDEKSLRPMILKDIAQRTGYDISTISRVSNSKYIQTEFGIYPVKFFFSEGMQTDSGEEVSSLEIKNILRSSIEDEDKQKPLTDEQLCEILESFGYQIARRTVAKYRDQLEIPVARLRREL
ncbi:MAG TPA: RNA polymerase factor sigma-54 [Bacteroidales bacterium]|nr:RNA polymerase factor sigma-54 [Bacteroidales bacterium]